MRLIYLMLGMPFVMAKKPDADAERETLSKFAIIFASYITVTSIVWFLAALFAVLLIRQTRRKFAEEQRDNLKDLIEGTLRDHERKK